MRHVLLVLCFFMLANSAWSADPPTLSSIATWSNAGAAGGTLSIARYRLGFDSDKKIPADYRVCNTSGTQTVTFEYNDLHGPLKKLSPGECQCYPNLSALVFRTGDSVTLEAGGTYEAFPPDRGCAGAPIAVAPAKYESADCKVAVQDNDPPGQHWSAIHCPIKLPKSERAHYRVCTTLNSFVTSTGGLYEIGNGYLTASAEMWKRFTRNSGTQPLPERMQLTDNCIDTYAVTELEILAGEYPLQKDAPDPYIVTGVKFTIQEIFASEK